MFKKPFPLILQHDSMECGIACLSMICKYHGREYSTRYLSRLCFATTEGVSLLGITEAAKALGLKTVAARVSVDELRELPLPCILHWNQQHFVVLYRIGKGGRKYDVADPGKGLVTYRREEFQKQGARRPLRSEPPVVFLRHKRSHTGASRHRPAKFGHETYP